ncbi:hypothetical protein UlMin_042835 [Ulmus minor]
MGRRFATLASCLLLVVTAMAMRMTMADRVNYSSSSELYSNSPKEGGGDLRQAHNDDSTADHFDEGGFSSLEGMLQWAIGHSDSAKLKEGANDAKRLAPDELKKRQVELKELMEKLKMPSDADLMRIAIDDLSNSSLSLEDRNRALQELLILVEPIDNANDLNKLGGLAVVIQQLHHPDTDIRKLAAWILGKASQNNPVVQRQVLELGALAELMKIARSDFVEEANKGLYAISALIRNNLAGQELFYVEAGGLLLQDILSNSSIDIRLQKKAVFLAGDLVESQLENTDKEEMAFFRDRSFLKSVVDLTATSDLDLQEKALMVIKNLLQLKTTEALVFKDECGLEVALERLRQHLQDLMVVEDQRDYAADLESLRSEVELIYQRKLRKVEVSKPTGSSVRQVGANVALNF